MRLWKRMLLAALAELAPEKRRDADLTRAMVRAIETHQKLSAFSSPIALQTVYVAPEILNKELN